jgi:hypothetical protein
MEGKCCICEKYGWGGSNKIVYRESDGMSGYCIYHAPAEQKWASDLSRTISEEEFSNLIFQRIAEFKSCSVSLSCDSVCNLSGVIFPFSVCFSKYGTNNPLPAISFEDVQFHCSVSFMNTTFGGKTIFLGSKFKSEANFSESVFAFDVIFSEAMFSGNTDFTSARFSNCSFTRACFFQTSLFTRAIFAARAHFLNAKFYQQSLFKWVEFKNKANFGGAQAENDGLVKMIEINESSLKNLTFSLRDLPLFTFDSCRWPTRLGLDVHDGLIPGCFQACEQLYRRMKKYADEEHDRRMVSEWHYREKLMGLKILLKVRIWLAALDNIFTLRCSWTVKVNSFVTLLLYFTPMLFRCIISLTFWYCLFSGFGEKIFRAGMWLAALLLLPFLAYSPAGSWFSTIWPIIPYSATLDIVAASVRDSVDATAAVGFIPFMKETNGPSGWLKVGQALWQGVILLQFTLFALAVRNRFRR